VIILAVGSFGGDTLQYKFPQALKLVGDNNVKISQDEGLKLRWGIFFVGAEAHFNGSHPFSFTILN